MVQNCTPIIPTSYIPKDLGQLHGGDGKTRDLLRYFDGLGHGPEGAALIQWRTREFSHDSQFAIVQYVTVITRGYHLSSPSHGDRILVVVFVGEALYLEDQLLSTSHNHLVGV